jgi:hypothetical protein
MANCPIHARETTGYEVADLQTTLSNAKVAGVTVLVEPYISDGRVSAVVQFPGGYVALWSTAATCHIFGTMTVNAEGLFYQDSRKIPRMLQPPPSSGGAGVQKS